MIETVKTQQILDRVQEVSAQETTTKPAMQKADADRFVEALGDNPDMDLNRERVPAQDGVTDPVAQNPSESMGDAILRSFQEQRDGYRAGMEKIAESISRKQEISPADLLRYQAEMIQSTFHLEMSAKTTDKVDQDISTLIHTQS